MLKKQVWMTLSDVPFPFLGQFDLTLQIGTGKAYHHSSSPHVAACSDHTMLPYIRLRVGQVKPYGCGAAA
jgi:hypothetical protein